MCMYVYVFMHACMYVCMYHRVRDPPWLAPAMANFSANFANFSLIPRISLISLGFRSDFAWISLGFCTDFARILLISFANSARFVIFINLAKLAKFLAAAGASHSSSCNVRVLRAVCGDLQS